MSKSRNLSDTPSVKGYLLKAFRNNLLDSLEKEEKHNDFIFIDEIPEVDHATTEEETLPGLALQWALIPLAAYWTESLIAKRNH